MADLSIRSADPSLRSRLLHAIDTEGKIPRALDTLGSLGGSRVGLLDADGGYRAAQLEAAGAAVTCVSDSASGTVSQAPFDVLIGCWIGLPSMPADRDVWLATAEGLLGPTGRLMVVQDYGRDDVSRLFDDPGRERELLAWSNRSGWFLTHGFKLRVLHCWWTWGSIEEAQVDLEAAFGAGASGVTRGLRRPRLEYKVAVYHRTVGDPVRPRAG